MKAFKTLFAIIMISVTAFGQTPDTSNRTKKIEALEMEAEPIGGPARFLDYIKIAVKYPEVAKLVGIEGKVNVGFTVARDGRIKNVHALDTIGAGCEEEAVRVVSSFPKWKPAFQNSVPVEEKFNIAVSFVVPRQNVNFSELKASAYAFIFEINGVIYNLADAENKLGHSFASKRVVSALPYPDKQKYPYPGKRDIYLIKIN